MNKRLTAAIAAGAMAVGLLVGAAGAVVVDNATTSQAAGSFSQIGQMHAAMGGQTGSGMMGSGSGMMGSGSGMMGGAWSYQDMLDHMRAWSPQP